MPELHPVFQDHVISAIANALGDTSLGLSGSEIGRTLSLVGIPDAQPELTKRFRLAAALRQKQARDRAGNCVIRFVTEAMAIGNYLKNSDRFEQLRVELDPALALAGLHVRDDGRLGKLTKSATTLDEVQQLAGRMIKELSRRDVHREVTRYCEEELLRRSTFHAVSEATKGLSNRLREMSGSALDGSELVDYCFGMKRPVIRINAFETKSQGSEHAGFGNLLRGVMGTFRNPTAHAPRTEWDISEADAIDLFSTLSYLHRRLDSAVVLIY